MDYPLFYRCLIEAQKTRASLYLPSAEPGGHILKYPTQLGIMYVHTTVLK